MRIVSEWKDYDNEVKQLWDDVYRNKAPTQKTEKTDGTTTQKGVKSLVWLCGRERGCKQSTYVFIYFVVY